MPGPKKIEQTLDILKTYEGSNPYILELKKNILINGCKMTDFICDYVIRNYKVEPREINKIVPIAEWYGKSRQSELQEDFIPEKIKIVTYLGDTPTCFHCYVQYRKSVPPAKWLIPKEAVLKDFLAEDYNKIQVDFERYDRLSNFQRILLDHQKEGVKFLLSRKKCVLADEQGLGKMEPVSSEIPTINGFKRMGDINVGDKIFGSDGKVYEVEKTFEHFNKPIYKVTFNDNTSVDCGLEHLWTVRDSNMRRRKQGWKTMSLEELIKNGLFYNNKTRISKGYSPILKYEIPITEPVQYEKKDFFIHPYILGYCIGDATLCSSTITISIPDIEKENAERISSLLNEEYYLKEDRTSNCPRYRIVQKNNVGRNKYRREIERLKLNVKGQFKFIPEEYKLGSPEQRLFLLRGLMDSDGTIQPSNKISFSTVSQKLAEDVKELVYSLGGKAKIHSYDRRKFGKNIEYAVFIQLKQNPFLLKRKADKYHLPTQKYCTKYIKSVEYSRNEDAKCLSVNSPDHTYLTSKNYVVTHNTTELAVAAIEGNFDSILIICPASLKGNWKRELSFYVPERDITIIDGFMDKTKAELEEFLGYAPGKSGMKRDELLAEAKERGQWKFNRFVIINYDILDKFFELKRTYTQQQFDDMLEKSPLLQFIYNKKSLIIIDEGHELSNSKSIRYKTIRGLINKGKPHSIYLATGTPITNDPVNFFCVLNLIENNITSRWDFYIKQYCGGFELCQEKDKRKRISDNYIADKKKRNWYDLTDDEKKELDEIIHKNCKHILIPKDPTNLDELSSRVSHIYLRRTKDILTLPEKRIHEVYYDLTPSQRAEYDKLWDEYEKEKKEADPEKELNKELIEGAIYRQYLSMQMVPHTEELVDKIISGGDKVVIACCYDEELYTLQEYYGDRCVIYNGKMSLKQKDDAIVKFTTDDNIKVFIGNIQAAGVGITLISAHNLIFNDFSYVSGENLQMSDRVHRIGQKKDVDIYYQIFNNTQYARMWEITIRKQLMIDTVIKKEDEKNS